MYFFTKGFAYTTYCIHNMKLEISKTNIITTPEQWLQFAPPKDKEKHWKDDRSAKSLALFMTNKDQAKKLETIFAELGYSTNGVIQCTPEANTVLPGKGNGRNHDLLMVGEDFVVGIEAKVSEPFGKSITKELVGASSNKQYRIDTLAKELFGCEINVDTQDLKYQLLTGVMGTLFEAIKHSKSKALFLVIVFTDGIKKEDEKALENNNKDFTDFCKYIGLSENGGTIHKLNVSLTIKKVEISLKTD